MSNHQHSVFSPSQLERIILCPGSVELCKEVPKAPTTSYAEEGTLLHTYAEQTLEMWPENPDIAYMSLDHKEAVTDAVGYLLENIDFNEPGMVRFQELKVAMGAFEEVYGTLDFACISPSGLHVADFKFGRGVQVNAFGNSQMMAYLDGFLAMLKAQYPELYDMAQLVPWHVHIVQPRINNYQKERMFPRDLAEFNALIDRTIRLAKSPNAPIVCGTVQCRWCDAGGVCRTRLTQLEATAIAAISAHADLQDNKADMETVQKLLERQTEVSNAFKAISQFVFLELVKGGSVPRFKLVRGKSNRAWANGVDFDKLTEDFPELEEQSDMLLETKLRGPAQVEKLLTKDRRLELAKLITKPDGKLSIASIDDPKPAVTVSDPSTAFAELADTPD